MKFGDKIVLLHSLRTFIIICIVRRTNYLLFVCYDGAQKNHSYYLLSFELNGWYEFAVKHYDPWYFNIDSNNDNNVNLRTDY